MSRKARKAKVPTSNKRVLNANTSLASSETLSQSTDAARTLYFHTGTHKTGSTALQVYLATNKTPLGEAGVSYEFPDGTDQSMGNGQYFYEQLYERNMPESQLEELLEFYLADRQVAICSSEDFTRLKLQEWQKIKDACHRLQVQARFVTFVRDIGPYYFSLHGQLIKGGENYASFDEFCNRDQYFPVLDSLRCLLELFGRESMSVIHYESAINCMDSKFMSAVGLFPEHYDNTPLKKTVNRSLTEYEQEILSRINETSGRQYSLELSDLLMKQRPHLKPAKHMNDEATGKLLKRHAIDVEWLNKTFFGGVAVVKISNSPMGKDQQNALSMEDRQAIDRDVANWCISKLSTVQDESIKYVTERLHAIDWINANNPAIPESFDPLAYLLLNTDVLKAGVPPYEHFIGSGQYENRRWEWMSR